MNFNDVAIVSVKESDYKFHFWHMSKNDAVSITNNSNFIDKKGCFVIFLLIYKKLVSSILLSATQPRKRAIKKTAK